MELGFAVLAAARAAEQGASVAEAAAAAREMTLHTRFIFVPDTLEYLRRGGRIGNASALVGTLLQIRPILTVVDGKTDVFAKVRTKRKAMAEIVAALSRDAKAKGLVDVVAHHIADEAEGRELAAMASAAVGREVPVVPVGPTIGTHVGPGLVGLVYVTDKPMEKGA
jgi:DegV family protein with EDD domain